MDTDLGYIAWRNDLSWMESQTGAKWNQAIKRENTAFQAELKGLKIASYQKDFSHLDSSHPWIWREWKIEQYPFSPVCQWSHRKSSFKVNCWSADGSLSGKLLAAAVQDPRGFERFSVIVFAVGSRITSLKTLVSTGSQVHFYGNFLVYLGSSKDLRYDSVHIWNPDLDIDTCLYTLLDPVKNLSIGKAEDGSVYVILEDFVEKQFGIVTDTGITWKHGRVKDIHVVSYFYQILNQTLGNPITFTKDPVEAMSLLAGWIVTRSYGIRTIWKITDSKPIEMITVWGEVSFDSRDPFRLSISDIRYEPYIVYTKRDWVLSNPKAYPFLITQYRHPAPSFVVYPLIPARGMLVISYGAYGSPTHIGRIVHQWSPLLLRGWIIATVCVPGSGDHDIEWKESGQHLNRKVSIDTLAKAVRNLQEETNIQANSTCLYGRSAGGLLVISTATMYPDIIGALYVESPYVDVLQTISNPDLPLTQLEEREYGTGNRPIDLLTTAKWSPMEHTPIQGFPKLFVVARSDTADLKVFPYEVMKWIWRIRGKLGNASEKKLLFVNEGRGHYATGLKSRAEDLALLDRWLNSPDRKS